MPASDGRRQQIAEFDPAHSTPAGVLSTGGYQLPLDMAEGAVRRLGWVALIYALTYLLMFGVYSYHVQSVLIAEGYPANRGFHAMLTLCAVATGLGVCLLAWSRKLPPYLMLDLGLLFEVLGAAIISMGESGAGYTSNYTLYGISSVAAWISIFILVVPARLGRTLLAALASVATGPLSLVLSIAFRGTPVPPLSAWLVLYVPTFVMAAWAILLSRTVYSLGAQVSKARAMGSYHLIELIGQGGMGEVWKARHRMLAREAAIKLIRPDALTLGSADEFAQLRRRFEREAQATAALHSPHTVSLYDYGVSDEGVFYYVMELLDGVDLESLVQHFGPVPAARAIHILRQTCDSLTEAHARGLTHRDIKPKNIFLARLGVNCDFVKVLDFGLVKVRDNDGHTRLTRDGITTGTPAFMAPEMVMGHEEVDARADIYALGCVAYWLVSGKLVFESSTSMGMALEHVRGEVIPPSERTEIEVPEDLERVILDCLEKKPARRPQNARALSQRLAACRDHGQWTGGKAEEWWRLHLPSVPVVLNSGAAGPTH